MIQGRVVLNSQGAIESFWIKGHQRVAQGSPALFCAVVSAGVRSFVRLCHKWGIPTSVGVDNRGQVSFEIKGACVDERGYRGICACFLQTLEDLQEENPALIRVLQVVRKDKRGG